MKSFTSKIFKFSLKILTFIKIIKSIIYYTFYNSIIKNLKFIFLIKQVLFKYDFLNNRKPINFK